MFPGRVGDRAVVEAGLPTLLRAMADGKIDNPRRQAAFLATLAHESAFEYSVKQHGATATYAGRGYIQLTGSANYRAAGAWLGVDLVANPDKALSLEWSAQIARWYWTVNRHCNEIADNLQMGKICAAVGYPFGDGTEDLRRVASFKSALKYLTGTVPDGITNTRDGSAVPPKEVAWSSTERLGQWTTDGYLVNNNVFNAAESGPQEMHAYSPHSWYVVADHSKADARPGSIKAYPDTQRNFTNRSIDSFTEITATWDTASPATGEYDWAFDIWVGGIGSKSSAEVMVWTSHRYNGPLPPKNAAETAKPLIGGRPYTAWKRKNGNGGDYIALVMDIHMPAGTVDLLEIFRWLTGKGWLKGTDIVAAIEYGVELARTEGGPQTFRLTDYQLTAK